MKTPSVHFALCASLLAGFVVVANAMPPPAGPRSPSFAAVQVQAEGGRSFRRSDRDDERHRRELRRRIADCHRDVRTHRINGERVRHRHVGENCDVRIVRKSTEPAPAD